MGSSFIGCFDVLRLLVLFLDFSEICRCPTDSGVSDKQTGSNILYLVFLFILFFDFGFNLVSYVYMVRSWERGLTQNTEPSPLLYILVGAIGRVGCLHLAVGLTQNTLKAL